VASVDADPEAAKELLAEMARDVGTCRIRRASLRTSSIPAARSWGLVAASFGGGAENVPVRIEIARDQTYPPEVAGRCTSAAATCSRISRWFDDGDQGTKRWGALAFDIVVDGDLHADRSLLRDRLEALGGRCAIQQESGHRTRVIGSLPLSA
jgi:hypothetical protein